MLRCVLDSVLSLVDIDGREVGRGGSGAGFLGLVHACGLDLKRFLEVNLVETGEEVLRGLLARGVCLDTHLKEVGTFILEVCLSLLVF